MTVKVFLATAHVTLADGLQALLEAQRDIKVVGKAVNGLDAVKRVRRLRPDVAIVALSLPGMNGIDATSRLRDLAPSTGVVILSGGAPAAAVQRALQAGAMGHLPREAPGAEVVNAVRAVSSGKRYLGKGLSRATPPAGPLDSLSGRERQVLQLVVEGASSARIAVALSLSHKTVDTYRSRIKEKLGIHHLPGLVKLAIREGLTPAD